MIDGPAESEIYSLTQGNGPWRNRAWTYDKIGNRLTFARTSEPTQSYTYSGTGHNPKLATITPTPGLGTGSRSYSYDPAGNQTSILESDNEGAVQTAFYDVAADGRMSTLRTNIGPSKTDFLYDGRGYLSQGLLTVTGSSDSLRVTPVYSSEGTLMARTEVRQYTGSSIGPDGEDNLFAQMSNETTQLFYFAGRPVAQLTSGPELLYLTTDHLGTPVLATDSSGAAVWAGGVEPFGQTWTAGPDNPDPESAPDGGGEIGSAGREPALGRLASEKVFLRYPGQWVSDAFRVTGTQEEIYYNVHRWYGAGVGRYSQADPLGLDEHSLNLYLYASANSIFYTDPLGLVVFENFPANKKTEAEEAILRIQQKLEAEPCCTGGDGKASEILAYINSPDFTIRYRSDLKYCGQTPFSNIIDINKRVAIGGIAWEKSCCAAGEAGVNGLASTILHEAIHGLYNTSKHATEAEKKCFGCG